MNKEIELLIKKSFSKDIEIAMLNKELEGYVIDKVMVMEIIGELLNTEIESKDQVDLDLQEQKEAETNLTNIKETCTKCDERGHIYDGKGGGYSCPCGKYNRQMEARFKNVNIMDLLAYGRGRIEQKKKQCL